MKRFAWIPMMFLLLLAGASAVSAQDVERRTYDVRGFTGLSASLYGTIHVRQGDTYAVAIEAPARVLNELAVSVEDGLLVLEAKQRGFWDRLFGDGFDDDNAPVATVQMPVINEVAVSGAADVVGDTPIKTETLRLSLSGAGSMTLDVAADRVTSALSGAGDLILQGTATEHTLRLSGAGEVTAHELKTARSTLTVSGAGDCSVYATDRLDVTISGVGEVRYKGTPKISQSVSGAGSIEAMDE
ncbi:head GIN domain-containing protein [Salisaeta longa]|uniref:head GIN domain-containing protein n=1 Tax=Salisaeta longa TaxID=503170 RepID=UPI0003FFCEC0|nr:head GIN domain-containing protein [Salisaeta longa]